MNSYVIRLLSQLIMAPHKRIPPSRTTALRWPSARHLCVSFNICWRQCEKSGVPLDYVLVITCNIYQYKSIKEKILSIKHHCLLLGSSAILRFHWHFCNESPSTVGRNRHTGPQVCYYKGQQLVWEAGYCLGEFRSEVTTQYSRFTARAVSTDRGNNTLNETVQWFFLML